MWKRPVIGPDWMKSDPGLQEECRKRLQERLAWFRRDRDGLSSDERAV
jgi:hypothetical protein